MKNVFIAGARFTCFRVSPPASWAANADGSGLTNVTRHDSLDYHPSGSLDGAKITRVLITDFVKGNNRLPPLRYRARQGETYATFKGAT